MITLYHAPQSRSSRMIWLLEELGALYEIKPVSIFRPMTGEGDPANPHPDKQVPAITDGDTLVADSVAIVLYLTDAFPAVGIGPATGDPRRGEYLTWLAWYAAALEPAMFAQFGGELDSNPMKKRSYTRRCAAVRPRWRKRRSLWAKSSPEPICSSAVRSTSRGRPFPEAP